MGWLQRINFYRQGLGLRPIRDDRESSSAAAAHARYLLLNLREEIRGLKPMSPDAYQEKPGRSGYTARGAAAAKTLQLAWGCSVYYAGRQIDCWIEGPFHRLTVFDPQAGRGRLRRSRERRMLGRRAAIVAAARGHAALSSCNSISACRCGRGDGLAGTRGARSSRQLPRLRAAGRTSYYAANRAGRGRETLRAFADARRQADRKLRLRRAELSQSRPDRARIRPAKSARRRCGGNRSARAASARLAIRGLDCRERKHLRMEL